MTRIRHDYTDELKVLGIDSAFKAFFLYGTNKDQQMVVKKLIKGQERFKQFVAELPHCLIGFAQVPAVHHWARYCQSLGHEVKLMNRSDIQDYIPHKRVTCNNAIACHDAAADNNIPSLPILSREEQTAFAWNKRYEQLTAYRDSILRDLYQKLSKHITVEQQTHSREALFSNIQALLANNEILTTDESIAFEVNMAKLSRLDEQIKSIQHKVTDKKKETLS